MLGSGAPGLEIDLLGHGEPVRRDRHGWALVAHAGA